MQYVCGETAPCAQNATGFRLPAGTVALGRCGFYRQQVHRSRVYCLQHVRDCFSDRRLMAILALNKCCILAKYETI